MLSLASRPASVLTVRQKDEQVAREDASTSGRIPLCMQRHQLTDGK
jgi:hypothetical protein